MCHKRDSLDKCVYVSLKILDPGIQDVASLTPSSEGEDTQDKDVKGELPAASKAAPGECAILSYFFLFFFFFFFFFFNAFNLVVLTIALPKC